jgi:arylsulfatase A
VKRRDFLKSVGFAGTALALGRPARGAGPSRPNIILLMADDFGYECLSCNGGAPYATPVLDGLAAEGARFSNCVAQPLCTPSRVKIMTGRYNFRNYLEFGLLWTEETTFGHVLRNAGYRTCVAGKWQLGKDRALIDKFGFDEYCLWWLEAKGDRYNNVGNLMQNGELIPDGQGKYGPDVVSDFLMDFISRHKDEPFFCYYPMILTHSPYETTPDSAEPGRKDSHKNFADMVAYTDTIVGRIVAHLEQLGIRDNTVILFTGDNGTGRGIKSELNGKPYPGAKGSMASDAGPHVPFVASWPDGGMHGETFDDPVDFSDFLPTLADLADAKLPEGVKIDGSSFAPRLRGKAGYEPRGWSYICYYGKKRGTPEECARDTRYHLLGSGELYDFQEDPLFEDPIDDATASDQAKASRVTLQAVLDKMAVERAKEDKRLAKKGVLPQPAASNVAPEKKGKRRKGDGGAKKAGG